MKREDMDRLVHEHLTAEAAGDVDGCVAMYTEDVVHDVVGSPTGPLSGPAAAKGFYEFLTANVKGDIDKVNHAWYGEDFCVIEHQYRGSVPGEFLGVLGHGKPVEFRMLHVWEFEDGKISRENVWLDSGAIIAQLAGARTEEPSSELGLV